MLTSKDLLDENIFLIACYGKFCPVRFSFVPYILSNDASFLQYS